MAARNTFLPVALVLASGLCASASWAGGFAMPHSQHKSACPTAVEKTGGQVSSFSWGENKGETQDMRKAGGDGSKAKSTTPVTAQNGMLVPAVQTPGAQGLKAGEAAGAK